MKSCLGCTERHPGCHGHCERYLKEKAKDEELKEKRRLSLEYSAYMCRMGLKAQKMKRQKKRR